jgi:hypothetical protein
VLPKRTAKDFCGSSSAPARRRGQELTDLFGFQRHQVVIGVVSVQLRAKIKGMNARVVPFQHEVMPFAELPLQDPSSGNDELLAAELHALNGEGFDVALTGFSERELDALWRRSKMPRRMGRLERKAV